MRNMIKGVSIALGLVALLAVPVTSIAGVSVDDVKTEKLWKIECSGIGG